MRELIKEIKARWEYKQNIFDAPEIVMLTVCVVLFIVNFIHWK